MRRGPRLSRRYRPAKRAENDDADDTLGSVDLALCIGKPAK